MLEFLARLRSSAGPSRSVGTSRRSHGQSLTEFALILPVMLALMGIAIDTARVYFAWLNLESATRDAAQYVANDPGLASGGTWLTGGGYYDPNDTSIPTNYCGASWTTCTTPPTRDAKGVLENETGRTFTTTQSGGVASCTTSPSVWAVLNSPVTTSSLGGGASFPVATVRVTACVPFRTLFPYPLISNNGTWTVRADRSFSTIVGR